MFVMDSRLPVDPKADKDDPNHPENVTKRALMMERQASADSKYDSKVTIREPFESKSFVESIDPRIRIAVYFLIAAAAIAGAVCVRFKTYDFERRIVCAMVAIGALHYAVAVFK